MAIIFPGGGGGKVIGKNRLKKISRGIYYTILKKKKAESTFVPGLPILPNEQQLPIISQLGTARIRSKASITAKFSRFPVRRATRRRSHRIVRSGTPAKSLISHSKIGGRVDFFPYKKPRCSLDLRGGAGFTCQYLKKKKTNKPSPIGGPIVR
jgi:hypothetical protein